MKIDPAVFQLSVNSPTSILRMIADGGCDFPSNLFADASVKQTFSIQRARLFYFSDPTTSDEAIAQMSAKSFRPATLQELLSFAISFPEEQRRSFIVALGTDIASDVGGNTLVAALHGNSASRKLGAIRRNELWFGEQFRLLGINSLT